MREGRGRRQVSGEKLAIVIEALDQGLSASEVSRRHGIGTKEFYKWRDEVARMGMPSAKSRIRRQELLEAAAQAFARKGTHATSIEDIAQAVGLTKASLYHYIDSKDDLVTEINDMATSMMEARLKEIVDSDLPPADKLRRAIEEHIDGLLEDLPLMRVLLQEHSVPAGKRKQWVRSQDAYIHGFRTIIEAGIETGVFRNDDPTVVTFLLLGMLNWITRWYRAGGSVSKEQLGEIASNLVISGLGIGYPAEAVAPTLRP